MEDGNLAVLVDAKTEYTKQLVNILKQNIYFMIQNLFVDSQTQCTDDETPTKVLFVFQQKLSEIPKWNNEVIKTECETIITNSKCDWIDELITAVFVSHTRILTSINFSKSKGKIDLKIPKTQNFIHRCFIDVARYFWKNSYLFDDRVNKYEFQKNRREAENMIEMSINETIRTELPVKTILKKYLGNDFNDTDEDEEAEDFTDEPISSKKKKNLKKMVMKELENCSNEKLNKMKLILDGDITSIADKAESVAEPVAEPVADKIESVAESVAEPVADKIESVAEPVAKSVAEPVAEPVAKPVAEPVADKIESVAEHVAEPVAEHVAEHVAEPVIEPVAEPVTEPVAEHVAEPVVEPKVEPSTTTAVEEPISIEILQNDNPVEDIKLDKNKIIVKKMDDPFELNIQEINLDKFEDLSAITPDYELTSDAVTTPTPSGDAEQIKKDILKKYTKNRNYQFFD
jgi:hypothetical protein